MCCGPNYTAAISDIGHLYTWGDGSSGKLGHGSVASVASPRLVKALSSRPVLAVSCGTQHMAAIVAVPGVTAFLGTANHPPGPKPAGRHPDGAAASGRTAPQNAFESEFGADPNVYPVSLGGVSARVDRSNHPRAGGGGGGSGGGKSHAPATAALQPSGLRVNAAVAVATAKSRAQGEEDGAGSDAVLEAPSTSMLDGGNRPRGAAALMERLDAFADAGLTPGERTPSRVVTCGCCC